MLREQLHRDSSHCCRQLSRKLHRKAGGFRSSQSSLPLGLRQAAWDFQILTCRSISSNHGQLPFQCPYEGPGTLSIIKMLAVVHSCNVPICLLYSSGEIDDICFGAAGMPGKANPLVSLLPIWLLLILHKLLTLQACTQGTWLTCTMKNSGKGLSSLWMLYQQFPFTALKYLGESSRISQVY